MTVEANRAIKKNLAYTLAMQGLEYLLPLLIWPYLSRTLGPSELGRTILVLAICGYLSIIPNWGFSYWGVQLTVENRNNIARLSNTFWSILGARLLLGLTSFALLLVFAVVFPSEKIGPETLLAIFTVVASSALSTNWFFQGIERIEKNAIFNILAKLVILIATLNFVTSQKDSNLVIAITGVCNCIANTLIIFLCVKSKLVFPLAGNGAGSLLRIKESSSYFFSSVATTAYTNTNVTLLGLITGNLSAGLYGGADKIRGACQNLIVPFSQVFFPRITLLMGLYPKKALVLAKNLLIFQSCWTFIASSALFLMSKEIVALILGQGYQEASLILKIIAYCPFLIGINTVLGSHLMLPLGLRTSFNRVLTSTAILNLIVATPMIFRFQEVGAAISVLICEVYVTALMIFCLASQRAGFFKEHL
ncbi:MAG TPA: oligosaccharide flippase family protein [Spongiibacteraceae bacterium]|jgi:O-antigen/teichoic acid export membrane protein